MNPYGGNIPSLGHIHDTDKCEVCASFGKGPIKSKERTKAKNIIKEELEEEHESKRTD
jgi:hypothetical protein